MTQDYARFIRPWYRREASNELAMAICILAFAVLYVVMP